LAVRNYQLARRVDIDGLLDRAQLRAAEIIAKAGLNHRTVPQWSKQ
jgi:hypothetical protein